MGLLSRISCVLVTPSKPQPCLVALKSVEAARRWSRLVDDAVGERERTHARRLASVGADVGAGHGCERMTALKVGLQAESCVERAVVVIDSARALLLLGERRVKLVVEVDPMAMST
jgi:hypothetical protein